MEVTRFAECLFSFKKKKKKKDLKRSFIFLSTVKIKEYIVVKLLNIIDESEKLIFKCINLIKF